MEQLQKPEDGCNTTATPTGTARGPTTRICFHVFFMCFPFREGGGNINPMVFDGVLLDYYFKLICIIAFWIKHSFDDLFFWSRHCIDSVEHCSIDSRWFRTKLFLNIVAKATQHPASWRVWMTLLMFSAAWFRGLRSGVWQGNPQVKISDCLFTFWRRLRSSQGIFVRVVSCDLHQKVTKPPIILSHA